MTPDERDDLARQVAIHNAAIQTLQETLDMISDKIDAAQAQNVRHIEHLRGDFKTTVEARADRSDVLAYETGQLLGKVQGQSVHLGEINAQLIERIGPVCDNLSTLTDQIRGLIGLTQVPV